MRHAMSHRGLAAAALASALAVLPVAAQQSPPAAKGPPANATKPATAGKAAASPSSSDNPLRARIEQLEEQLVDLQVTIGTLESLARTTGSPAATSAQMRAPMTGGGDTSGVASRVDGLEIQMRALVGQVEQLTDQVRALNGRRSAAPDAADPRIAAAPPPLRTAPPITTAPEPRNLPSSGFGSTTVTPAGGDPIGGLISEERTRPTPAAIPGGDGASPKQLYETAYGYLLQQNYGAAETAFEDFLTRHPSDGLAGNAQYWLGESHFVRGQYKQAAGAFLKGYQTYARSAKAPDSLLKLAMSLDRLGQKDAACTSYGELNTRFPNAPQNIKARADSERRRIGCP